MASGARRTERLETTQLAGRFLVTPADPAMRCLLCKATYLAHTMGTGVMDPYPCKRFTPRLGDRIRAAFAVIWWAR